ncbi:MAG: selenide, water dikinase SelD [Bauldia litoralis]
MAMTPAAPVRRDIVLVGGGHAHVHVVKMFGMKPQAGTRLTVISAGSATPYSGMLPGYLAGHYSLDECHIDLRKLCTFAGARFIEARAEGIDRAARRVHLRGRPPVAYDLLGLDIGSTPRRSGIAGAEKAIPVKPVDGFLARWAGVEAMVLDRKGDARIVVIGAGAGGTEAALALRFRLAGHLAEAGHDPSRLTFTVVDAAETPLSTHSPAVQRRMRAAFAREGIAFVGGVRVTGITAEAVLGDSGLNLPCDAAVLITPGGPAPWLADTGLALDERGFVRVRDTLQTVSDDSVFAAGDIAAFEPGALPKSGVYAVRQGPVLARNLRAAVAGERLTGFRPQSRTLALISMGQKRAVLSYGPLAAEGDWAWRFKDWIDRRWMRKYRELPDMAGDGADAEGGADPMRCGGCGAKVPADILRRVLAGIEAAPPPGVLVGLGAPDDAAVIVPAEGRVMVQTVDQFRAFVDDPYVFAQIAANHALGDIFAMGATARTALATVTLPFADPDKMEADLDQLLRGAVAVFDAAGVALIGGHTGEGAELSLGFTVNGDADPDKLMRKGGARPGDLLILTKPLGTGVILAGAMRGEAEAPWVDAALASMLQSSLEAADILLAAGATACTDVTGFGLAGHLGEMLEASGCAARIDRAGLAVLAGAEELFGHGVESTLQPGNARVAEPLLAGLTGDAPILFDPQTAGGLLASVPDAAAELCVARLRDAGYAAAAVIGRVVEAGEGPRIHLG